ncbi:MAG: D-alanyl-D-alanine carboxypeptidase family protein, partial [Actinomycetales bacterium]
MLILRRLVSATVLVACLMPALGALAAQARAETIGGERLAAEGVQVDPGPDAQPLPDIRAASWVIADATTGAILAAKDAHLQRAPASTLKTLTALTVLPNLPLDGTYRPSHKDAAVGGTRVGLVAGKPYTIRELLYGAFLSSGNDAATALARANGGVRETVQQMNALAAQLQAFDTVAINPTGLDEPGQLSSAYDLALFARAGLARPDFAEFARTKTYDFPSRGSGTYRIYNTNRLLMSNFRG